MRSPRSRLAAILTIALPCFLLGTSVQFTLARLTSSQVVGSNTFTTAAAFDTVAPTVSATVISKTGLYFASYVKQGGPYYVYANATDGGASPSGIATITANVSAITTGQTAAPLVAGSYTVEGVTYGFRTAALTATTPIAAGAKAYSLTSTDNRANSRLQTGFSVTVDNTAPAGSDIQCANGAATIGTIEVADVCTFTFSEIIDPESILAGWNGASTNVVFRLTNMGGNDPFSFWDASNTTQLNFGTLNSRGNYGTTDLTAGASGTPSTMVLNTATNTITITLGTVSGNVRHDGNSNKTQWTPSAAAFDRAGNAMSTTMVTEANPNDDDF